MSGSDFDDEVDDEELKTAAQDHSSINADGELVQEEDTSNEPEE